jgi:hypothetical protein
MRSNDHWLALATFTLVICGSGRAQDQMITSSSVTDAIPVIQVQRALDALTGSLKESLVKNLPKDFTFDHKDNWGHQAHVPSIRGLKPITVMRNHGDLEQVSIVAVDTAHHLKVQLGQPVCSSESQVAFTVNIAVPAEVLLRKKVWENGLKVYSNHVRANLLLCAEVTVRCSISPGSGSGAGSATTLEVVGGKYSCSHFVAHEIDGRAPDGASLLETKVKYVYRSWQPGALAEFQGVIDAALRRAADERDERNGKAVQADVNRLLVATLARQQELQCSDPTRDLRPEPEATVFEFNPFDILDSVSADSSKHENGRDRAQGSSHSAHEDSARANEHLGLSNHTIQVGQPPASKGSGSGSGSGSHQVLPGKS